MRPIKRNSVNKKHSAKVFKRNVGHTKAANLPRTVMRGGWRL